MGPVEEDDQVLNFFPWTSLVDYYDPDTNGWCGYCCVGWATGIFEQDLADSSGTIIREMLKETLQEFRKQFLAFFGRDDYMQVVDTLTRTPDNTTDWWFSAPACLWVAVVTFRTSFFFADIAYQQAYLLPVQVQAITPPLLSSPSSLHSNAPRPPPLYKGELHITTLPAPSRQPPHLSSSFPGAISSPKGPFLFLISLLSSIHPSIRPSFLGNNISSYLSGRCLPCACVCVCIVDVSLMILVERWWARSRLSEFCVCCLVLKLGGEMLSLLMRPRNARVSSFVALKFRGKFGRCVSASFDMNFRDGERGWFLISIFSWHADKIS